LLTRLDTKKRAKKRAKKTEAVWGKLGRLKSPHLLLVKTFIAVLACIITVDGARLWHVQQR